MTTVQDVYTVLTLYGDLEDFDFESTKYFCERGLNYVFTNLKPNVSKDHPLIATIAAALAHYYFSFYKITASDKYESYKAGDLTIKRSIKKEKEAEEMALQSALAEGAEILEDRSFLFIGL